MHTCIYEQMTNQRNTLMTVCLSVLSAAVTKKMMSNTTHYDILGIPETATLDEIKAAHREKAKQYHPDRQRRQHGDGDSNSNSNSNRSDIINRDHEDLFIQIQMAWECLRDAETRAKYDDMLRRKRDQEYGMLCKAQVVKLSDMKVELCEVVVKDEDDDNDYDDLEDGGGGGNGGGNGEKDDVLLTNMTRKEEEDDEEEDDAVQCVYTYPCRCGDMFEILQQDLPLSSSSSSSSSVLLECQSCGLSIQVHCD